MDNIQIKKIRKELGLTQKDFGEKLGVGIGAVQMWERGARNISKAAETLLENLLKERNTLSGADQPKNTVTAVPYDDYMMVEFVDLRATAGYIGGQAPENLPETHTRLVPREYEKGNYLVIRVDGDSMDDGTKRSISDGEEILIKEKKISSNDLDMLPIKTALFVITTREGNVVKQIQEINREEGYVILKSFNPKFKDYKVSIKDIFQIFIVCKVVNKSISLV